MYAVMGATGHVGSAVMEFLRAHGEDVIAITHDAEHADALEARGAEPTIVDIRDADGLRAVFRRSRRAFLLNPPGDVSKDSDREELETIRAILAGLEDSNLELVVAESTYGAQPGERCGDLTTLYTLEEGLKELPFPAIVQRGAYYMSNYDSLADVVAETGALPSMLPAEVAMPMVAPVDLGRNAGRLLRAPHPEARLVWTEGPQRYSPADVADAFAAALGREVTVDVVPQDKWESTFRQQGFSPAAAVSYAKMTKATVDGGFTLPEDPTRGPTTLRDYIHRLVAGELRP